MQRSEKTLRQAAAVRDGPRLGGPPAGSVWNTTSILIREGFVFTPSVTGANDQMPLEADPGVTRVSLQETSQFPVDVSSFSQTAFTQPAATSVSLLKWPIKSKNIKYAPETEADRHQSAGQSAV